MYELVNVLCLKKKKNSVPGVNACHVTGVASTRGDEKQPAATLFK